MTFEWLKLALKVYAEIILNACYASFMLVFISAYNMPSKTLLISINKVGEATPELILLVLAIPLIVIRFKKNIAGYVKTHGSTSSVRDNDV